MNKERLCKLLLLGVISLVSFPHELTDKIIIMSLLSKDSHFIPEGRDCPTAKCEARNFVVKMQNKIFISEV